MATEVILPRVDMDMAEGKVAHWYVKDGDAVRKGQVLFEIETDKATMEVDATADGVMHGISAEIGVPIPVGQVIGWILSPGEAPPGATAATPTPAAEGAPAAETASPASQNAPAAAEAPSPTAAPQGATLLRATPLARSLAREHVVDLGTVSGSGPDGRVLGRDVLAAVESRDSGSAPAARPDLHLQWARRGSGTPLLLLHGFGADQGSWRPLWQQWAEGRPVVGIDLPNHGKSVARPVRTLQEVAAQVLARLDEEGIAAVHIVAHSLGGGVALALAQAAPERVRSLTLLAPAGLGPEINADFIERLVRAEDEAALKTALATLFHDPAGLTGSFVATAFQQLQAPQRRLALAGMAEQLMPRGRQAQGLREVLEGLRVPVQVIWGRSDRIIPMRHAADLPDHVGVHWLPSVGHLPQVEAASIVAALVDLQLRGVAEPG